MITVSEKEKSVIPMLRDLPKPMRPRLELSAFSSAREDS